MGSDDTRETDALGAPAPASGATTLERSAERVIARVRRHGRMLLLPALVFIFVGGGTTWAWFLFDELWQQLALLSISALVVVLACLLPLLAWLTRRTTITSRRLILQHGVFVRVRQELLHSRGYDILMRRTPGQSMFGSGDVRINTGHEHPVVLKDVPKPRQVQSALHELQEHTHTRIAEVRRAEQSMHADTIAWG